MPCEQLLVPVHRTSHAHELPHETFLQDCTPAHVTEHGPIPHCTFSQDCRERQSMSHDAPCVQLIPLRHAPSVLHWISHL